MRPTPTANQILDENGNPIPISNGGMSYGDEPMIELYAVTQEQYDAVMAVIDSTTSFVDYDQNVLNIISDEAAGYLAGNKTVRVASGSSRALYIQNRNNQPSTAPVKARARFSTPSPAGARRPRRQIAVSTQTPNSVCGLKKA